MLMVSAVLAWASFPCLAAFSTGRGGASCRPSKQQQRWQPDEGLLDGGNSVKRNSRSKKGLGSPLLADQPLSSADFPKDVKVCMSKLLIGLLLETINVRPYLSVCVVRDMS